MRHGVHFSLAGLAGLGQTDHFVGGELESFEHTIHARGADFLKRAKGFLGAI